MLRHISVLLVSVLVLVALAASVALAAPPAGKGQPGATDPDPKSTGSPTDPNCWGEVTSQVAGPTYGEHASSHNPMSDEPRLGVGNVARNDGGEGGRPSDHGAVVGPQVGASCEDGPETG
jgi:hypothetical protein